MFAAVVTGVMRQPLNAARFASESFSVTIHAPLQPDSTEASADTSSFVHGA